MLLLNSYSVARKRGITNKNGVPRSGQICVMSFIFAINTLYWYSDGVAGFGD